MMIYKSVIILITLIATITVWIAFLHYLDCKIKESPRKTWDIYFIWLLIRAYCRLLHHPIYTGLENIPKRTGYYNNPNPENYEKPKTGEQGPLIVVANHTACIDPLLIQAPCFFEIRWLMMGSMNISFMKYLTRYGRVILVNNDGKDLNATRESLRHLRQGGTLGIFPEGHIERPQNVHQPFLSGVGLLIAKSNAAVLPVWVSNTPYSDSTWKSIYSSSNAHIVFAPIIHFDGMKDPDIITRKLQEIIAQMSQWPVISTTDKIIDSSGENYDSPN